MPDMLAAGMLARLSPAHDHTRYLPGACLLAQARITGPWSAASAHPPSCARPHALAGGGRPRALPPPRWEPVHLGPAERGGHQHDPVRCRMSLTEATAPHAQRMKTLTRRHATSRAGRRSGRRRAGPYGGGEQNCGSVERGTV
ncbi:unnamed protein product [Urochloa humidicola]